MINFDQAQKKLKMQYLFHIYQNSKLRLSIFPKLSRSLFLIIYLLSSFHLKIIDLAPLFCGTIMYNFFATFGVLILILNMFESSS